MRGVRNVDDFRYEKDIAAMNHYLDDQVETIIFLADPKYQYLSSSLLKEVAMSGGNIAALLPANINEALQARLEKRQMKQVKKENEEAR